MSRYQALNNKYIHTILSFEILYLLRERACNPRYRRLIRPFESSLLHPSDDQNLRDLQH